MAQVKLIVSNWKMNLNYSQSLNLIQKLKSINYNSKRIKNIICPQFMLIPFVAEQIKDTKILLGAQDCHYEKKGSYTGDTSLDLIKKMKCKYVIVGHSERRLFQCETNQIIRKKVDFILSNKLSPIVCVGESLQDRKQLKYIKVVQNQLNECIPNGIKQIIVAYEPIWSIGTGVTPSIEEVTEMITFLKSYLHNTKNIKSCKILYGGSVSSNNFKELVNSSNANGALIGGASLKNREMKKILTFG